MSKVVRFVDLFCGIGGFRVALQQVCEERDMETAYAFSSDIDPDCQAMVV
jgi:DNA (cytosine-5)-methyltransferase 1